MFHAFVHKQNIKRKTFLLSLQKNFEKEKYANSGIK